jgi:phosphatidylglycerol:prolipoprotein diacylglycerol transferase
MSLLALFQEALSPAAPGGPTFYEHDLSPVLVRIPFPKVFEIQNGIPIRYYSLAYLLGLAFTWWFVKRLARRRAIALDERMVADMVIPYLLLGVMIGGRVGYLLFYDVDPLTHRYEWIDHPSKIVKIWEGGMASHGGVLGVLVAMWMFARSRKVPLLHLLDLCCLTAPVGLFLGRVANFVNGELWGRVSAVPWAVVFTRGENSTAPPQADVAFQAAHPELHAYFQRGLAPRHPSQLYEALGEGLLLFLLLYALHRRLLPRTGALTGIFLLGYGLARVVCERFREPDRQIGFDWLGLTRGQILTSVMLLAGALVLVRVLRRRTSAWSPPPISQGPEAGNAVRPESSGPSGRPSARDS